MPAKTHFNGRAGQFAAMGELAIRGYNLSVPEVDVGDDIIAEIPNGGKLIRVQVKTSMTRTYTPQKNRKQKMNGWSGQVMLGLAQLTSPRIVPKLYYVFSFRNDNDWIYLVVQQTLLRKYHNSTGLGTVTKGIVTCYCTYDQEKKIFLIGPAKGTRYPLTKYLHGWHRLK